MRPRTIADSCAVFATVLLLGLANASAAETLGDIFRASKWDRIVGTWVDAETMGANFEVTYAWKIKDRVLEVVGKEGETETVALLNFNRGTDEVSYSSADSRGASSFGKWSMLREGALVDALYTADDGQTSVRSVQYRFEDDDTLVMSIQHTQQLRSVERRLLRAKR